MVSLGAHVSSNTYLDLSKCIGLQVGKEQQSLRFVKPRFGGEGAMAIPFNGHAPEMQHNSNGMHRNHVEWLSTFACCQLSNHPHRGSMRSILEMSSLFVGLRRRWQLSHCGHFFVCVEPRSFFVLRFFVDVILLEQTPSKADEAQQNLGSLKLPPSFALQAAANPRRSQACIASGRRAAQTVVRDRRQHRTGLSHQHTANPRLSCILRRPRSSGRRKILCLDEMNTRHNKIVIPVIPTSHSPSPGRSWDIPGTHKPWKTASERHRRRLH